jgi:hypothetical protein
MPAGYYDILCEQGATLSRTFTWKDKAGELIPLGGYSARMQVRPYASADETILDLTSAADDITFPSAGKISLTVSATATAELVPGTYAYDLELESPTGVVKRLLEGKFTVKAEVTR